MINQEDYNDTIVQWFADVIENTGTKQKDMAALLRLPPSAISQVKSGKQKLSATQMLIIHNELGVPFPTVGNSFDRAPEPSRSNGQHEETKALFDATYDQVMALDAAAPDDQKMSKFELLEAVFHIMNRVSKSGS